MKVLVVVEDDRDMQLLIEVMLGADGRLDLAGAATTASEAIDAARREQPDLIVLDHFIDGDVMGIDAAPELKQAAPHARILLCTSHDLAVEAERSGSVDGFLNKNDIQQLLPTVQQLLGITQ
ncbi:MAG: family transcriptional regulator [Thermoleophilia bacterium]|nr:family transcriptional regulator [Thermoleophilia bacterium]